jgi:transcriptional regulator with XRE-family HTH domain
MTENRESARDKRKPAAAKKRIDTRDIAVGRRVRAFRLRKKMSQKDLGDELGVTFQQIQKYEKGTNRIGAGRLQRIAEVFGLSVNELFGAGPESTRGMDELFAHLDTAASLRFLRAFSRIQDARVREALTVLLEKFGGM